MKPISLAILFLFILGICAGLAGCAGEDDDDDSATNPTYSDDDAIDDDSADDDTTIDDDDDDDDTPKPTQACDSGQAFGFTIGDKQHNVPYPNNIFLFPDNKSATGRRVELNKDGLAYLKEVFDSYDFVRKAINQLEGFGLSSPVWFPATKLPNGSQFPSWESPSTEDAIFCAVLEQDENHPYYKSVWPLQISWQDKQGLLRIVPFLPFTENTTYACVITDKLKTAEQECYAQPDHLAYILGDEADSDHPDTQLLEPYREKLAPEVGLLKEQYDIDPDSIVGLTIFKTLWASHDLINIRNQLTQKAQNDPPVMSEDWTYHSTRSNLDSVWENHYETVSWQNNGIIKKNNQGDPVQTGTETVTLRLNLPEKDINGFQQPYPVIIYGHGINSSRNEGTGAGSRLAPYGFATLGIDWVWHGDRSGWVEDVNPLLQEIVRFLQIIDVTEPLKFRDNFKQDVSDIMWLLHLIRNDLADLDLLPIETGGDGIPDLDVDNIFFMGMSLGSIHGGIVAAMEPDFNGYLLNVPAAEYRSIILDAIIGSSILDILDLLQTQFNFDFTTDFLTMADLLYSIADAGDPYSYGDGVFHMPYYDRPTPNVFLQMAAYDETLGGPAGGRQAKVMGVPQIIPDVWPIDGVGRVTAPYQGSAVYMWDTSNHNMFSSGDNAPLVQLQAGTFLRTVLEDGIGTIIIPTAP